MLDESSVARLLISLYAAPIDTERWGQFMRELCAMCGVHKSALIVHDMSRHDHRILAFEGDEIRSNGHLYESYFWQFDEWTSRFSHPSQSGRVLLGAEVWPECEFQNSLFYNEFLKEHDIFQLLGVPFSAESGVFEAVSLYRGVDDERFGQEEHRLLNAIKPHLKCALEIRRRLLALETRVADLETAMDSLASALVLIDASGKALYVNKQARAILAGADALSLRKGSLIARNPAENSALRTLIEKAIAMSTSKQTGGSGAMRIARAGRCGLHVLVSPVIPADTLFPRNAAAAVFLDDPEMQPVIPAEVLRSLYGLTPAEARLALLLAEGHSLGDSADRNHVSRETIKSQMNSIFSKTGTSRQGELIALLSRVTRGASTPPGQARR